MVQVHKFTQELLSELFSREESRLLESLSELLLVSHGEYMELKPIWQYDKSLGGLGGYAMPTHLTDNPFNKFGRDRNIFRSIQYAKSSLVLNPLYPRGAIVDVGRSLEFTLKYIADVKTLIAKVNNRKMAGWNLDLLHKKLVVDDELYNCCRALINLTNIAKHEIREDDLPTTFTALDSLVAYFSMRKIQNILYEIIDHPYRHQVFNIYEDNIR